jgi:hypothetical protein
MSEIGRRPAHERVASVLSEAAEASGEPRLKSEILMQVAQICEVDPGLRARRKVYRDARHRS